MSRKLLLLGLLRIQEMHGYQINELIDTHLGTSVQLKKPTVYKLLAGMVEAGWITAREEQEGSYPPRRVYSITAAGEAAFLNLLRQSLVTYSPPSHLDSIGIIYLNALPAQEAAALLRQWRDEVAIQAERLRADDAHHGGFQLMLSYSLAHLTAELDWLDEQIERLNSLPITGHQPQIQEI
jgi:DNA-binding PadR family transcriptional regulator